MAKRVDWAFIKPLWCAGGLSNREIAQQYNDIHKDQDEWKQTITEAAIRQHAKNPGKGQKPWKKSLIDRVKREAKEKMLRTDFAPQENANHANQDEIDEQIIDQAAETMVRVMQLHRKDIEKLKALEDDLIRRLKEDETQVVVGWYQGEASEHEIKLGLEQRSRVYQRIVGAIRSRIKLERLAWGIDDKTSDKDLPDLIEVIQEF